MPRIQLCPDCGEEISTGWCPECDGDDNVETTQSPPPPPQNRNIGGVIKPGSTSFRRELDPQKKKVAVASFTPKIERGIPRKKTVDLPFDQMRVGDSFFVPLCTVSLKSVKTLQSHLCDAGREFGEAQNPEQGFQTSRRDEVVEGLSEFEGDMIEGVRVWRVI